MPREGKTVAKSFRVNEKALGALQEEAARQSVSVYTLVNQLLLDYSEFGRFLQRVDAPASQPEDLWRDFGHGLRRQPGQCRCSCWQECSSGFDRVKVGEDYCQYCDRVYS